MTTPTIYRVATDGVTPAPGSGQFNGYKIVNGTLVPNSEGGTLSDTLSKTLSAVSDYSEKGLLPKMPAAVLTGLSTVLKIDAATEIATNLIAGKTYEAAIAYGQIGYESGVGATTGVIVARS
jgi:hypothetical protein